MCLDWAVQGGEEDVVDASKCSSSSPLLLDDKSAFEFCHYLVSLYVAYIPHSLLLQVIDGDWLGGTIMRGGSCWHFSRFRTRCLDVFAGLPIFRICIPRLRLFCRIHLTAGVVVVWYAIRGHYRSDHMADAPDGYRGLRLSAVSHRFRCRVVIPKDPIDIPVDHTRSTFPQQKLIWISVDAI